jgi:hypothetical protein
MGATITLYGGASSNERGQKVVGSATNDNQTDSYDTLGYNNTIIEDGGNLDVNAGVVPPLPLSPSTTIEVGSAIGVSDTIDLAGASQKILQLAGSALSNSYVRVVVAGGAGSDTVKLVNNGGVNDVAAYGTSETVNLVGAVNAVTAGAGSKLTVNGDAQNQITTGTAKVRIGKNNDGLFGYAANVSLTGDGNELIAGDENVTVTGFSQGGNTLTLGNGDNTLSLSGQGNLVKVGQGSNFISAGSGVDTVDVGSGSNTIDLSGNADVVKVADRAGTGFDTIMLNGGTGDVIVLGGGGALITYTGPSTPPGDPPVANITQDASSKSAVTLDLGDASYVISLGDGDNIVTGDAISTSIRLGNGNNVIENLLVGTITAGNGSDAINISFGSVKAGTGADSISIGDFSTVVVGGGNDTVSGFGYDIITAGSGNDLVRVDGNSTIVLGNGDDTVSLGTATSIRLGKGNDSVIGTGGDTVIAGAGSDTVSLGPQSTATLGGGNDVVTGFLQDSVTAGNGNDSVNFTYSSSSLVVLGNGDDTVQVGTSAVVQLGHGSDSIVTGDSSHLYLDAGHDTIAIGSNAYAAVVGSSSSQVGITLANTDVVGFTGGRVTVNASTNELVYLDGVGASSSIQVSDGDNVVVLGSNASANVVLDPTATGDVVVQALSAAGTYTGTVDLANFINNDTLYLGSLVGGRDGQALTSYAAVADNIITSGTNEILALAGGGKVVFSNPAQLSQASFGFTPYFGTVVPTDL